MWLSRRHWVVDDYRCWLLQTGLANAGLRGVQLPDQLRQHGLYHWWSRSLRVPAWHGLVNYGRGSPWMLQTGVDHTRKRRANVSGDTRKYRLRTFCSTFASSNQIRARCVRMSHGLRMVADHWCWLLQAWIHYIHYRRTNMPHQSRQHGLHSNTCST